MQRSGMPAWQSTCARSWRPRRQPPRLRSRKQPLQQRPWSGTRPSRRTARSSCASRSWSRSRCVAISQVSSASAACWCGVQARVCNSDTADRVFQNMQWHDAPSNSVDTPQVTCVQALATSVMKARAAARPAALSPVPLATPPAASPALHNERTPDIVIELSPASSQQVSL
jgi:hypothetical protein